MHTQGLDSQQFTVCTHVAGTGINNQHHMTHQDLRDGHLVHLWPRFDLMLGHIAHRITGRKGTQNNTMMPAASTPGMKCISHLIMTAVMKESFDLPKGASQCHAQAWQFH